jgi:HSP20 family protein
MYRVEFVMSETITVKASHSVPPAGNRADVWRCFRSDLDKLLDRVESTLDLPSLRGHVEHLWPQASDGRTPFPVRASETETAFTIDVMLPGAEAKNVDVALGCDHLNVRLRRDRGESEPLQRTFALPDNVRRGAVTAVLRQGVLTITLPKALSDSEPRNVAVATA